MKKLVTLLFMICSELCFSQNIQLSASAQISVITCGPFQEELYSAFGHSAFRVYDPVQEIDDAYNYGVFDFNQPHFYLNFARGYLFYKLGVYDYQQFKNFYVYYNRTVHEQVLNLTPEQKQKVYDYLQWNARPENVNYRYDYFYDNCATKIRDVIVKVFGEEVKFDGSYIATNYTIRDLTDIYLKHQPWGDLGIDICLGLPMDKKASPYEYMFLPDYIESGFAHANILQTGTIVPLVSETIPVYEARDQDLPSGLPHPLYVFSFIMLAAIALSIRNIKKKKLSTWFDAILFGTAGLIGILLFFLWFATDHKAAAHNFNLLWAVPTHIVALIAFIKQPRWLRKYFLAITILSLFLLIGWPFLPQELNSSLIPICVALTVRSFCQYWIRNKSLPSL